MSRDPSDGKPLKHQPLPFGVDRAVGGTAHAAVGWQGLHEHPTLLPGNFLLPRHVPSRSVSQAAAPALLRSKSFP